MPCLKSGDKTDVNNYRPIAILSVFSKIFELAMCNRLISFVTKYNILNDSQYGFIKGRSTISAIGDFVTKVLNALDNRERVMGIFYDFSKAFDTVNHRTLLEKLRQMGISGLANDWIASFIKDRRQVVKITDDKGSSLSEETTLNVGVPQGATLSPLLFILFTNDIPDCLNTGSLTLYADDTTHFIKGRKETIINVCKEEVNDLASWCNTNDLFINKNKTLVMQFSLK
jgi:retron-type reverse transcriptase